MRLSPNQFSLLNNILNGKCRNKANEVYMGTLGSLILRDLIFVHNNKIQVTSKGYKAYEMYVNRDIPLRDNAGPITDYVSQLIKLAERAREKVVKIA